MKDNLYIIKPETKEEILAVNDLLIKMREEAERKRKIQHHKNTISFAISDSVSEIGLAQTKTIVRELARELKEVKEGSY